MTREERRARREWETAMERDLKTACKETGKRRGWKTVSGEQYQVRDGMLYILYVSFPVFDVGRVLKAHLHFKPVAVDEMYWDVFHMREVADSQPFSFHVKGAFTARGLWLPLWKEPVPSPEELPAAVEAVFDRAEALVGENAFPDPASYRKRLEAEERPRTLEIILALLCEGAYEEAMERINAALARGDNGGFSREAGRRSIMEDARDYCAARLEERA